jgi:hypothetical protein
MAFLLKWTKKRPTTPPRVATDQVVPLYFMDDNKINRSICIETSMRFDYTLGVEKLKSALERVLVRPGWRKLGARLRLNASLEYIELSVDVTANQIQSDGKLEYRVPAQFTQERPSVTFVHTEHDHLISQNPLGSKLPIPSASVQLSPSLEPFRALFIPKGGPLAIDDWLYTDRALLTVNVVSFADATLVTLSWMHIFLDAMSQKKLLTAWTAALEGREGDIPEYYGADFDPLETLGEPTQSSGKLAEDTTKEPYVLAPKAMTTWKMIRFVVNYIWSILLNRVEETRIAIIPAPVFANLKAQALRDLSSVPPSTLVMHSADPRKPFLSDGDVLCAWWIRQLVTAQPNCSSFSPTKTIQIMNVLDMRDVLTNTSPALLRPNTAYIGNCNTQSSSFFSFRDFVAWPLGRLAACIRSDLVAQSTRAQLDANLRLAKPAVLKSGFPPLYGEGDMMHCAFSNWHKGNVFETDFGAAVVGGESVIAKPTYVHVHGKSVGLSMRNSGMCSGRDAEGNWWVGAVMTPGTWEGVEKAIQELR